MTVLARGRLLAGAGVARARRVAARGDRGVAVLMYHRVIELPADPQMLAVSPATFDAHLAIAAEVGTVVAFEDIPALLRARRPPRRPIAITLDDGYADNLLHAKPALERRGVPATVFVASGYVGAAREFWWDELERLLLLPPSEPRTAAARVTTSRWTVELPVADDAQRRQAYEALHPRIRRGSATDIEQAMRSLRRWAGEPEAGVPRPDYLAVDHDQLRRLDGGAVTVGGHTRNHLSLAAQPSAVQHEEIAGGSADLADWLGRPVTSFSYPYGTPGVDVGRTARRAAKAAGHALAGSNWPQRATTLDRRYALPRYVVRDWPADRFERWLTSEVFGR